MAFSTDNRTDWNKAQRGMYVVLAIVGVLILGALGSTISVGQQISKAHLNQPDAVHGVKTELLLARLSFDQVPPVDEHGDISMFWNHLDNAESHARVLVESASVHSVNVDPVKYTELSKVTHELQENLEHFRELATQHYLPGNEAAYSNEIDPTLDVAFRSLIEKTDIAIGAVSAHTQAMHVSFRVFSTAVAIGIVLLMIVTGAWFRRLEKQGTIDREAIHATREELVSTNNELIATNQELEAQYEELETQYDDIETTNKDVMTSQFVLGERVKELNCLYGISHIVDENESIEQIMQGIVDLIPNACQHPDATVALIRFEGKSYVTRQDCIDACEGCKSANLCQRIVVGENQVGEIKVCCIADEPDNNQDFFLKEEQHLLNAITERLGRVIERKQIEKSLRERIKELQCLYAISHLTESDRSLNEVLQAIVELVPNSWQFPSTAICQIRLNSKVFRTSGMCDQACEHCSKASLRQTFVRPGSGIADVQVCYTEDKPEADEGSFLLEERDLINAIAERLGAYLSEVDFENATVEYQDKLRAMTSQLALAEERERRRLASQLHDRIGHALVYTKIKLDELAKKQKETGTQVIVKDVLASINRTVSDIRSLTFEISPPVLHDVGLGAALAWLVKDGQHSQDLAMKFTQQPFEDEIPEETRVLLFQATRELVFNVVKHAKATTVEVSLAIDDGLVRVGVADDGCGFESSTSKQPDSSHSGFGLFSIRERIEHLGGTLTIESSSTEGTAVSMNVPLTLPPETENRGVRPAVPINTTSLITVLIADDHQLMRQGLRTMLRKDENIQVIGEAANGQEAIDLALQLHPDVILMDIDMPLVDGITAAETILATNKDIRIIALSSHANQKFASDALQAGIRGYLLKDCAERDLAMAIYSVVGNVTFLSSEISDLIAKATRPRNSENTNTSLDLLTSREQETLHLLIAGESIKSISAAMGISQKTVRVHRQNTMNKLGVDNLTELIKFALKHNFLEPNKEISET